MQTYSKQQLEEIRKLIANGFCKDYFVKDENDKTWGLEEVVRRIKNKVFNPLDFCYCIQGAYHVTCNHDDDDDDCYCVFNLRIKRHKFFKDFKEVSKKMFFERVSEIPEKNEMSLVIGFNNHEDTTKEEMLSVLDMMLDKYEELNR